MIGSPGPDAALMKPTTALCLRLTAIWDMEYLARFTPHLSHWWRNAPHHASHRTSSGGWRRFQLSASSWYCWTMPDRALVGRTVCRRYFRRRRLLSVKGLGSSFLIVSPV